tara:strand:- start:196 stop:1911 length:1716 start_codon:yes stop_codon:yes gene_type:complete
MSTIKISELATGTITLESLLAFADANGFAFKGSVDELNDLISTLAVSGMKGAILLTDASPTEDGLYPCSESGTYTNFNGLTINLTDTLSFISVSGTQTVFNKVEIPINIVVESVFDETNNSSTSTMRATSSYVERFPYAVSQITDLSIKASKAVKELWIKEYDNNYYYYLIGLARHFQVGPGYPANLYNIKVSKVLKTNTGDVTNYTYTAYSLDEGNGTNYYESLSQDFFIVINWFDFPTETYFDVNFSTQYLLDQSVGSIDSNPIIKSRLDIRENETLVNQFILGAGALSTPGGLAEYNIGIGEKALFSLTSGGYNVAIGFEAMKPHLEGAGNIAIGMRAMASSLGCIDTVMIGWEAGKLLVSGVGDTGVGRRSLATATLARGNTAFGDSTLFSLVPDGGGLGDGNVAIGYTAGEYCETITNSTLIGLATARNVVGGNLNVVIGSQAMLNRSADSTSNTIIGSNSMLNADGNRNTALGAYNLSDCDSHENTAIGYNVGNSLSIKGSNVFIGANVGSGSAVLDVANCIVVGANCQPTKDDQVVIGKSTHVEMVLNGVVFTTAQLTALEALV